MTDSHARLILAGDIASSSLPEELKRESADVRHLTASTFGIDEARRLKEMSAERSFAGGDHYFVISANSITSEAQNAILKLFEDPTPGTIFYLLLPSASLLLPTLRSRLSIADVAKAGINQDVDLFCRSSYKERLDWIADKAKKDPQSLLDLVRSLGQASEAKKWSVEAKKALLLAERYVYNRGASKKMLVEELALSLPIEK